MGSLVHIGGDKFNEYRIRFLGKRLKQLRTHKKRLESTIAAFEQEISERSKARKEQPLPIYVHHRGINTRT